MWLWRYVAEIVANTVVHSPGPATARAAPNSKRRLPAGVRSPKWISIELSQLPAPLLVPVYSVPVSGCFAFNYGLASPNFLRSCLKGKIQVP